MIINVNENENAMYKKHIKIYRYNIYIQYIYVYINNNISTYKLTPENKEIMIPFSNSGRGSYKILTVYT